MAVSFLDEILVKLNGTSSSKKYLQLDGGGGSGSVSGQAGIGFRPLNAGSNVHASIEGLENGNASYQTHLTFSTNGSNSDSAPSERMRITSAGDVGIGTTSPSAKLQVTGASGSVLKTNGDIALTTYTGDTKIDMANNSLQLLSPSGNVQIGDTEFDGNGTSIQVDDANSKVVIAGKVGIGTTAPTSNLHILGSAIPPYQLDVSRDNDGTGGPNIKLFHSTVSPSTSDAAGSIYFAESKTGAQATEVTYGRISVLPSSVTSNAEGGVMTFALADGVDASVDEAMRITQDGKVGIGTTSPSTKLDVNGTFQATSVRSTGGGDGGFALRQWTGSSSYASLVTAGMSGVEYCVLSNGTDTFVGAGTGGALKLRGPANDSSPEIIINGVIVEVNTGDLKVTDGSIAVGNITNSTTDGRIDASNDVVAFSTSDIRLKDNIKTIDNALDKVNSIQGIEFDWIEKEEVHGNSGHDIGVIAQEIEKILPDVVTTRDNGYKAVKYEKIVPLLIEAIKDLSKQVDGLKRLI